MTDLILNMKNVKFYLFYYFKKVDIITYYKYLII